MRLYRGFSLIAILLFCSNAIAEYHEAPDFNAIEALAARGIPVEGYSGDQQQVLTDSDNSNCVQACAKLASHFSTQTTAQGSPENDLWRAEFWSQFQKKPDPACIFQPETVDDVATVVLISRWSKCPFAVKSGGHAAFTGGSNIHGGISVDLVNLKGIEVSDDKKVAKLGTGNRWYNVYEELKSMEIGVIGGRVADIGVGGFTLGGGLSFFSGEYGWGCDNVVNFEVVTAAGDVLHVNHTSYTDLYWALRGGGNVFGIVTRFDLETFPLPKGEIWGGSRTYLYQDHGEKVIDAFIKYAEKPDQLAAIWMAFALYQETDLISVLNMHKNPVPDPPIFDNFKAIPSVADSTKTRTLSDLILEVNTTNPKHLRQIFWTNTFKVDADLINFITTSFFEELKTPRYGVMKDRPGHFPALVFQIMSKESLKHMSKNGGNPIPLIADEGPYMNLNYAVMWPQEEDDVAVTAMCARIMQKAIEYGKKRGLFLDYIYMNYASEYQDVFKSYGEESFKKLTGIAAKYDPQRVFQVLQPGYFKFDGPPNKVIPTVEEEEVEHPKDEL